MKTLNQLLAVCLLCVGFVMPAPAAEEAPDALVKRLSQEIIDLAKTDKDIQAGNQKRILDLVETKVLPFIDFGRMTSLAAGRYWRDATPEQQKQLTNEFRTLLVYTYANTISQIKDQRVEFRPFRAAPEDTEVEVKSQIIPTRGEPIILNYRLEKTATGWKIYDISVLGAWLVETYKGNFSSEIKKTSIDGLIRVLSEKNAKLAANGASKSTK
ncbi:MAG: ABC transporter substrate-binding protein [Burkholderiaceae bacterium]|nr:ABC transporter substrate-binding protein [Burkholderiaceae bacterium]